MWRTFRQRTVLWDLPATGPSSASKSDMEKSAYELRLVNLLLPTILDEPPVGIAKRESPDFKVTTSRGTLFVEVVDAVPDGITAAGTMKLTKRRDRQNSDPYNVDSAQFGKVIAREIEIKREKVAAWLQREPELNNGRLILLVNGGQGPLVLREYFRDAATLRKLVDVTNIDPFHVVAVGDETGAFVWDRTSLPVRQWCRNLLAAVFGLATTMCRNRTSLDHEALPPEPLRNSHVWRVAEGAFSDHHRSPSHGTQLHGTEGGNNSPSSSSSAAKRSTA
jgi:hypothetical protein